MSTPLIVNNQTFNYPVPGDSPGWGEDATAWAEEVTTQLNTVTGPNDIPLTSANLGNNVAVATNVIGLFFSNAVVRGADITYTIYRTSSTITTPKAEEGTVKISFNGTSWDIIRVATNDTGIDLTITNAGQVQYKSTDVGATGYSGVMKFSAKSLAQ